MNSKIQNYVNVLFADVPGSKKAKELKEEMLSNMSERFDDYIAEGKTENQAYSLVVSSMGDIDEMLAEVMPTDEFVSQATKYRTRNARNTAIGVAMYILGAMFLIGFSSLGEYFGNDELMVIMGLLIMLGFVSIATGLLIFTHMSTPPEYKDYDDQSRREARLYAGDKGKILKSLMSVYWSLVTFIYLAISFMTMQWGTTWLIWVLAGVFSGIIETLYEMRYTND